jgi:hypothetical protein
MAMGNTSCGMTIPQDLIDRPADMTLVRALVHNAETFDKES